MNHFPNHYLLTQTLQQDHEVNDILIQEIKRQSTKICLIPFENIVSKAVLDAQAIYITTNPQELDQVTDQEALHYKEIENIAIKRACDIFNCKHANVKPSSTLQAIQVVIESLVKEEENILLIGYDSSIIMKNYNTIFLNTHSQKDSYNKIDYSEIRALAFTHKPKLILVDLSNYTKSIDWKTLKEIANENNALLVANTCQLAGLIAGRAIPSPFPYANIVTGATHNTLRGPAGGFILTNSTELIDKINKSKINEVVTENCSTANVITSKAICFEQAKSSEFKQYAHHSIDNARAMSEIFIDEGLDVLGEMTETNIIVVDLSNLNITSNEAIEVLKQYNILIGTFCYDRANNNKDRSIILFGTQFLTSCGTTYEECQTLAKFIAKILKGDSLSQASLISIFNKIQHTYKSIFPDVL